MVPIWSKHGPDMFQKSRHSIDMFLRPYLTSLENFIALAGSEVKLGNVWSQYGHKWSGHDPKIWKLERHML